MAWGINGEWGWFLIVLEMIKPPVGAASMLSWSYHYLSHRLRIDPLSVEDCENYITTIRGGAGCQKELFTRDAISMICEASFGTLCEIDRICQAALACAATRQEEGVGDFTYNSGPQTRLKQETSRSRADSDTASRSY